MPRQTYTAEQINSKLREAEVLISRGITIPEMPKTLGISHQTYYRWPPTAKNIAVFEPTRPKG